MLFGEENELSDAKENNGIATTITASQQCLVEMEFKTQKVFFFFLSREKDQKVESQFHSSQEISQVNNYLCVN